MDEWVEYKCSSGQALFVYNKLTGEHKWMNRVNGNGAIKDTILYGQPIEYKQFCSIATQTDDISCQNGCTSKYIMPHNISIQDSLWQPEPVLSCDIQKGLSSRSCSGSKIRFVDGESEAHQNSVNNIPSRDDIVGREVINIDSEHELYVVHLNTNSFSPEINKPDRQENHYGNINDSTTISVNDPRGNVDHYDNNNCNHDNKKVNEHDCQGDKKCLKERNHGNKKHHYSNEKYPDESATNDEDNFKESRNHLENQGNNDYFHGNEKEVSKSKEKPFQCVECGKCFARKFNLGLHQRTHTGEKPYQCDHCNKKFAQKSNLYVHLRKHSGEKPYQCKHCDKAFGHKCNLYNHLKAHSGDKPFECLMCNKTFLAKKNLMVHLRSHNFSNEGC